MASQPTPTQKRPGCVTIYAILLGIVGAVLVVLALMNLVSGSKTEGDWRPSVIVFSLAVLCFSLVRGLWLLENWARLAVIALHGLGVLSTLFSMYMALTAPSDSSEVITSSTICVSGIPLALGACVAAWFILNGQHFGEK